MLMVILGRLPASGIVDMDDKRIDKVIAARLT
jgi:hypothetical protein